MVVIIWLDDFSSHITRLLDDWKHALDGERSKLDDRLEAMSRERSDLSRSWEMQTRSQREEQFKERQTRENEFAKQVAMLSAQITDLAKTRRDADPGQKAIEENLQRILSILTQTPQAKDLVVLQLETEKAELIKAIKERHEALQEFAQERRDVEKSMGDGLMALTRELEEERARTRAEQARGNARQGEIDKLNGRLADLEQAVTDRDMRIKHLIAEREDLAHALATEADKVHAGHKERLAVVNAIELQMTDLRKQLEEETTRRTAAEGAATMARSQMNALAEQTARSLQERDTIVARFSDWEKERQRLAEIIRKKDEMIGLLSSTFSGALKKGT
jgi:chromosome segregation ATPase